MNTNTTMLLAALTLSGCVAQPQQVTYTPAPTYTSTVSVCQQQQRDYRAFMAMSSVDLDECIARPGPICLTAATRMKEREQSLGLNHALMKSCFAELKQTDPDANLSLFNELLAFNIRLEKAERILRAAAKRGRF